MLSVPGEGCTAKLVQRLQSAPAKQSPDVDESFIAKFAQPRFVIPTLTPRFIEEEREESRRRSHTIGIILRKGMVIWILSPSATLRVRMTFDC